jgi:hypothetical protein
MIPDLNSLLPKVRLAKQPKDPRKEAGLKLREYFHSFYRRKLKHGRSLPIPPKFTLFLEPCPYLSIYMEMDEKLPMKKLHFTSFRIAYRQYMNLLKKHKANESRKNKASLLT